MRGCDRMTWIGGEERLKYPEAKERYVFEMLCPPENYDSPEIWEQNFTIYLNGKRVELLGPFPREGEYELVRVIETPITKAFVPLTETICDALVATAKLNRELPERIKREAAQQRREKEEKDRQQRMIDRINDMSVSPVMRQPQIVVPDMSEITKFS